MVAQIFLAIGDSIWKPGLLQNPVCCLQFSKAIFSNIADTTLPPPTTAPPQGMTHFLTTVVKLVNTVIHKS